MTLPILLIFYVSKWKNNKKHWKIGIWRHCDVIIRRGKSKLGVGLLCTEMIIVCKFHDPSIIGSRDTEGGGGSEEPPQSQIDQKSPVWIGLTRNEKLILGARLGSMVTTYRIEVHLQRIFVTLSAIGNITYFLSIGGEWNEESPQKYQE